MRNLNSSKKITDEVKIVKHVTQTDRSDKRIFESLLEAHEQLRKTNDTGKEIYPIFEELHQDLFNIFFKYKPIFNNPANIDLKYFLNESIIKAVTELDKYKEARVITKLDQLATAVGMEYMGEEIFKLIQDVEDKNKDLLDEIRAANEGILDLEKQADDPNLTEEELDILHMKYEDAVKLLQEHKKNLNETIQKDRKPALNRMIQEATKKVQELDGLISAWGLGQSSTFTNTGYQEKIKLLDRLRSPKLKQISELLGRYKQLAMQAQREKVKKGFNEIYDVVSGKDLKKALPSELARLTDPTTEDLFMKDFSEGKLLQYVYESKEKKQQGPIVILIDNSGKPLLLFI